MYPKWTVRNQLICGGHSSSVQLRLMCEKPLTLDEGLQLVSQLERVEVRLHDRSSSVAAEYVHVEVDNSNGCWNGFCH